MNCPTCKRRIDWEDNPYRPFCSERCKLVDLGRWMSEEYRVAGKEVNSEPVDEEEDRQGREEK